MGWGRFLLLGDWGQQLDLGEHEQSIRRLRREAGAQWSRDADQDARIEALQQANDELRLYVFTLVRVLRTRGLLSDAELQAMIDSIEKAAAPPPADPQPEAESVSPDLEAIRDATEEVWRKGPRG